jgi:glycosyltransferase involved in cell wall biosynthesis
VVPAYNNTEFIERTIDSILNQTYGDLEIIIADHASTDGTWALLQKYLNDERVTLVQTEAGGGALRNWNRVSHLATSEYIKLVCGDDLISPTLIERQVSALDDNAGATLTACARDIIDANDVPVVRKRGLGGISGLTPGSRAIRTTVVLGTNIFGEPACVMMRRASLERAGWWDSSFPYLIDETTYARVLLEGDFVAIPDALAGFRVSHSQWSVKLARSQAVQAAGFHRWLFDNHPGIISQFDLWRGDVAASLMAFVRRSAYVMLKTRMRGTE